GDESAIAQLQRRYVDRDAHGGQTRGTPAQIVADGFGEGPAPDAVDQSGFFQDWDERAWRHETRQRIVPADQRLDAGQLAALEIDLGLVMKHEFFPVERQAQ